MKRYRFFQFNIDSSRNLYTANIPEPIKTEYQEQHEEFLRAEYGTNNFDHKFDHWREIPTPVLSVLGEHTQLLKDIERAYVSGGLYPAMTGACCLGERIFNQVILSVRDEYKSHEHYKEIHKYQTIIKWELGIETMSNFGIISDETAAKYRELHQIRIQGVHFQAKTQDLGALAKRAIELINGIVADMFGIVPQNRCISWCEVPGEIYLRKEYESDPFVKKFYLPATVLVGYKHRVATENGKNVLRDASDYPDTEISDEEFVRLRKEFNSYQKSSA